MIARIQKWRFKKVAKKMSLALIDLHGEKKIYSADELEGTIRTVKLKGRQKEFAYAMFANEVVCNRFLSRRASTWTAKDLRSRIGKYMFGSATSVDYESSWNRFHDYNNQVLGGIQSLGSSFTGGSGGSGGGWDGGAGGDCGSDGCD